MKRTLALVLLAFCGLSLSAAEWTDGPQYRLTEELYQPTSARVTAMGGSSLAVEGYADSFLSNPAALGDYAFRFSLPAMTVTVFHPTDISRGGFFDHAKEGDWAGALDEYLRVLTYGQNEVQRIDVGANLQLGHLGLSVQTQERLFGYLPDSSYVDGAYVLEDTTALTLGLGFRLTFVEDLLSLDLGTNVQLLYQFYSRQMDRHTVEALVDDPDSVKMPITTGWSLPVTVGATLHAPWGFNVSTVARGINGKVYCKRYEDFEDWDFDDSLKDEEFTRKADVRYDGGLSWQPEIFGFDWVAEPVLSLDLVDISGIEESEDLFERLYAGAQVRLLRTVNLRVGLGQGYLSVGAGLDLASLHLDISYWRREYGETFLDKSIDALSFSFTLFSK